MEFDYDVEKMIRDYFADLELEPTDDFERVKSAYRRLAKKFHPDSNPLDNKAAESFRRIQDAFDHLDTEAKVKKLKKQLQEIAGYTSNVVRWKLPTKRSPRESGVRRKLSPRKTDDLDIEIEISFSNADWHLGSQIEVPYEYLKKCSDCRGRGAASRSVAHTCKKCVGRGVIEIERGAHRWTKTCDTCFGRGDSLAPACDSCESRGRILVGASVKVRPEDFDSKSRIHKLHNRGHFSFDGHARGDLILRLK